MKKVNALPRREASLSGTPIKMNSHSQQTLRRVQENDDTLTELRICRAYRDGIFISTDGAMIILDLAHLLERIHI